MPRACCPGTSRGAARRVSRRWSCVEHPREVVGPVHDEWLGRAFTLPFDLLVEHVDSEIVRRRTFYRSRVEVDNPVLAAALGAIQVALFDAISPGRGRRDHLDGE